MLLMLTVFHLLMRDKLSRILILFTLWFLFGVMMLLQRGLRNRRKP
jgi:hypothetical protein